MINQEYKLILVMYVDIVRNCIQHLDIIILHSMFLFYFQMRLHVLTLKCVKRHAIILLAVQILPIQNWFWNYYQKVINLYICTADMLILLTVIGYEVIIIPYMI